MDAIQIGKHLFRWREYTAVPLLVLLFAFADPSAASATIGVILVAAGETLRIYSSSFIGGVSRTRGASIGEQLITSGPYRIVRNPIYVGNFLIVVGFGIYAATLWVLLLGVALFALQYFYIVQYEHAVLAEAFADKYEQYRDEVPGWIPREQPKLDEIAAPPRLFSALKSEKRTLTALALVLLGLMLTSV